MESFQSIDKVVDVLPYYYCVWRDPTTPLITQLNIFQDDPSIVLLFVTNNISNRSINGSSSRHNSNNDNHDIRSMLKTVSLILLFILF